MSVVFLPNQLANGRLKVEIAWGADLTANPGTWTWTEVSSDVLQGNGPGITITLGRANEASVAQPATCTFRLKNQTGAYTPYSPTAANYPNVRLGTPVKVTVSLNGGSSFSIRFQGEVASWSPGWDAQGEFAYVALAASGRTRRLGSGSKPLRSSLYRAVTTASTLPTAYWPCEDGADGLALSSASSPIAGVAPMVAVGASNFASTDGAPGSGVQPSFTAGGSLIGQVPTSGTVTSWRVQAVWKANKIAGGGFAVPLQWETADGNSWELDLNPGELVFSETVAFSSPSAFVSVDDGLWHEGRVYAVQSGGNINITVFFDGVQVISESIAGTVSPVTQLQANSAASASTILAGIGHFAAWNGATTVSGLDTVDAMRGHAGETAAARITRLCGEEKISLTVVGGPSNMTMGPQRIDTLLNLLRECEAVDLGYLLDGLGPGLTYVCRSSIYNEAAQLTVNANSGQVPATPGPQPTSDDLRLLNRVTVTRTNGGFAVVEDTNGPLGTANVGVFDNRFVVNNQTDGQLDDIGSWIVHSRTVEGMRYPLIPLDFMAAPELAASWVAAIPTDRIDVTNLGSQLTQHPAGTVSLLAEGWTETLNSRQWKVTASCSPFRPWEVCTIQDARLGRIESDGSTLNSSATSGATSLSVASSGAVWDTAAASFDIDCEGEQITVTAVTGSTSPQTFTVTRSVNGVVKAHNSGAVVKLWKPGVLAL